MTVTFYKFLIGGFVLLALANCSHKGEIPVSKQWNTQQNGEQEETGNPGALEVCLPEAGSPFHLRKAILVAGTIGVPDLARDLPGLANLTSKRLQTHLDELERFNVLATHDSSFESMASGTAARVRQLGREYSSQFVVKLELQDLTMHTSRVWIPKILGGNTERNVLMKLYVYGTEYGALFHSQRYQDTVTGNVVGYPGNGNTVTTPWFNSTTLGKKIDEILKNMSTQINEKLACVPFSTEVTAVKGNNIHINAGYLHGIRPGATLRVYRNSDMLAPDGTKKQREIERWIKVKAVFPNRSIASTTQDLAGGNLLDIGDVVRAW